MYPKWYMKTEEGNEYGACGILHQFANLPTFSLESEIEDAPRVIGGQDFFMLPRKGSLWNEFPKALFALPTLETFSNTKVYINSDSTRFPVYSSSEHTSLPPPIFLRRRDIPSKEDWCASLKNCIAEMGKGTYEKIVLARAAHFIFSSHLSPFSIAKHLMETTANSTLFLCALSKDVAFIGATPEYLFQQSGDHVFTHAIAGTRRRGATREQDIALENELLSSCKEQSEFSYVYKDIENVLAPYCTHLHKSTQADIIKTATVQHLIRSFSGVLKSGIPARELLAALHPTPAVGGHPRESVCKKIYDLESFDRGWYAAPFGYITKDESKIVVAIRSALISHMNLIAFAGTGIVESSDPYLEWEELNNKISHFTQWIG